MSVLTNLCFQKNCVDFGRTFSLLRQRGSFNKKISQEIVCLTKFRIDVVNQENFLIIPGNCFCLTRSLSIIFAVVFAVFNS